MPNPEAMTDPAGAVEGGKRERARMLAADYVEVGPGHFVSRTAFAQGLKARDLRVPRAAARTLANKDG